MIHHCYCHNHVFQKLHFEDIKVELIIKVKNIIRGVPQNNVYVQMTERVWQGAVFYDNEEQGRRLNFSSEIHD